MTQKATQELLTKVLEVRETEFDTAVQLAKAARREWRDIQVTTRQRYMYDYLALLRAQSADIAHSITLEHTKIFPDSQGDVFRGVEVVEHACGTASLIMGGTVANIYRGIDTYS